MTERMTIAARRITSSERAAVLRADLEDRVEEAERTIGQLEARLAAVEELLDDLTARQRAAVLGGLQPLSGSRPA